MQCTVDTVLYADDNLTQVAQGVEKGTLKLKQENLNPFVIIIVPQATCSTLEGTEEGWLSHANVPKNNSEVRTENLETNYHDY